MERFGPCSLNPVLIVGPRFTGSDHSEFANDIAWIPSRRSCASGPQAANSAAVTEDARPVIDACLMVCPLSR